MGSSHSNDTALSERTHPQEEIDIENSNQMGSDEDDDYSEFDRMFADIDPYVESDDCAHYDEDAGEKKSTSPTMRSEFNEEVGVRTHDLVI